MHNRAACVGHIVDQDGNLVLDISHQNHGGHLVGLLALLVYQGELHIQAIGNRGYTVRITYKLRLSGIIRKRALNLPLGTASIGRHNDRVLPLGNVLLDPLQYRWLGIEIINWYIKETLGNGEFSN